MYVPFYARYGILSEDSSVFSNITGAYKYIRQNMFNEEYKTILQNEINRIRQEAA